MWKVRSLEWKNKKRSLGITKNSFKRYQQIQQIRNTRNPQSTRRHHTFGYICPQTISETVLNFALSFEIASALLSGNQFKETHYTFITLFCLRPTCGNIQHDMENFHRRTGTTLDFQLMDFDLDFEIDRNDFYLVADFLYLICFGFFDLGTFILSIFQIPDLDFKIDRNNVGQTCIFLVFVFFNFGINYP
ncbi:unnamed protein product [Rhizophagus irregularis]|nr:unnamed protein product [Rhizophagus irregularis]